MTPDDDPPPKKKYPRASWEPPDPDEPETAPAKKAKKESGAVSSETSGTASGSTRSPTAPVSKTQEPEPSVVVRPSAEIIRDTAPGGYRPPEDIVRDTAPGGYRPPADVVTGAQPSASTSSPQPSASTSSPQPSASTSSPGSQAVTTGSYSQPTESAYSQPTESGSQLTESAYAQPSDPYSQPVGSTSGSYSEPGSTSGPYSQPTTSGSYSQPVEAVPTSLETAPVSTSAIIASEAAIATSGPRSMSRDDEPLLPLPTSLSEDDNDLRAAIGAKPKKVRKPPPPPDDFGDDEDGDGPKKRSKLFLFVMLFIVFGLTIGAFVIFGHINKQRYVIACEPQQVIAKQGRGFPPWGERSIDDDGMWKPIKIPPEAECRERETEDIDELSRWYLDILMDRASSMLTAREVTKIDDAAGMLDQALLHARQPERRSERRDIERLLGDVGYWRASAKLKDAANALTDAAKQFDSAAAQRPRHVSDASAWATYVRKIADELKVGPNGALTAFPPTPPVGDHQPAPPGVALPVEPPPAGSGSAEPPPVPPDAGLPTGGVLL